jgi:predicted PurR-regulated permease PerM
VAGVAEGGRDEGESSGSGLVLATADETATQEDLDEIHAEAEAAAGASEDDAFGHVGQPFNRRSPFYLGFFAALGVVCAAALAYLIVAAGQVLVLLGLAFFLAVGLDPAVRWLYRRGLPRWAAVVVVVLAALGILGGFLAIAIPVVVTQATHLATNLPHYVRSLNHHSSTLGRLSTRLHLVPHLQTLLHGHLSFGTLLGLGKAVLGLITAFIVVVLVTMYLLVDMPRVKRGIYQLAPHSRRPRMVLLTNEILDRVGGYVLGNLLTSAIAGVATWVWALAFGIPYSLLLGMLVAILDLIPIVGSTVGGIIVSLVALTVSLPVAIATAVFYTVFRVLEDYLLTPRIMARTVAVPGLVTIVATVIGGALLGIIGALVAIPAAAALKLLFEEITVPRLDRS